MAQINSSDVAKLRNMTGAGMMDCKKALEESDGDFEKAIDVLRKKGQKVAMNRAERDAKEGVVLAKASADNKTGVLIVLNCETDFVAKTDKFVTFAQDIVEIALAGKVSNLDALKDQPYKGLKINDEVINQNGVIGEKIDLAHYDILEAEYVATYIHAGNKLATMVAFNKVLDSQLAKDVAMQVAAMSPIAVDKGDVPQSVIDKEVEIGKELARQEGKPEDMLEKIALGRLNKFYQEATLLNQTSVKENKLTISQVLANADKDIKVLGFKRYSLK